MKMLGVIERLTKIGCRQQLAQWATSHFLDHCGASSVFIGHGRMQPHFSMTPYFASAAFPDVLIKTLGIKDQLLTLPLLNESHQAKSPVMSDLSAVSDEALWHVLFRQKGFSTVIGSTNVEMSDGGMTYVCVTDPEIARNVNHHDALRQGLSIVTSILHGVLNRLAFEENLQNKSTSITTLTPREREILGFIRLGKTNSEISYILGVADSTVKNHVQRILIKLQVSNRTQAIAKIF
ncbi:helix-turn-helix transcriptional regulator [Jeongeupia wiesaeckerbachi]|uniref:response regulator transcription factor n=1 Tax=Jeongeupia wiesaeckerbachi TaxID=3051218 RepID=UPI003D80382E